jgi:signal transduction histidine kinase
VQRIVEEHHGHIEAANRDGGGLRIELILPVTERLPDGDQAANDGGEADGR